MAIRKSVESMDSGEVAAYRDAVGALKAISAQNIDDERGFHYFAGLHGLPVPTYCAHGDLLFLPWHRAYLYFFERALQDAAGDVGVPWWDWLSDRSHAEGLPPAFAEETADGAANPLARTNYDLHPRYIEQMRADPRLRRTLDPAAPDTPRTVRRPRRPIMLPHATPPPGAPPEDIFRVDDVLASSDFIDFSIRLEQVHGWVHVWVGGSMREVPTAAFDPIFWSHHAMIDRLWYLWQMRHGEPGPDESLWDTVLTPFPVTVRDMLSIDQLDYEYAQADIEL